MSASNHTVNIVACEVCGKTFHRRKSHVFGAVYCSKECLDVPDPIDVRLHRHIKKTKSCWNWTASTDRKGYGQIMVAPGKLRRAHRVSWELINGPIPNGLFVLHRCDNPLCVNPDHLFLGTNQDNVDDMVSKGRNIKGSRCPWAKLTESAVVEIRKRYKEATHKHKECLQMASEYKVCRETIRGIAVLKRWKHVRGKEATAP